MDTQGITGTAWKDKYLDYEIETAEFKTQRQSVRILEKKSISITRLKQDAFERSNEISIAWKEKYLDYEIET